MKTTTGKLKKMVLTYLQEEWEIGHSPNLLQTVYYFKNQYTVNKTQVLIALSRLIIKGKLEFDRVYEINKKGTCRLFGYRQMIYTPIILNPEILNKNIHSTLSDVEDMISNIEIEIDTQHLLEIECEVLNYLDDMHDIGFVPTLDRLIHDFETSSKNRIFGLFYTLIYLYDSNEITIDIVKDGIIRIGSYDSPSSGCFDYSTFITGFFKFFIDEDFNFCWDLK